MKTFALIALLIMPFLGSSQVKFSAKTFDNGFRYPVMVYPSNTAIQDSINSIIIDKISDLKASDFCIGDYGYVQKGNHIELHLVCNCIEMSTADHRYYLFNLVNGTLVDHIDLFDGKKKDIAMKVVMEKIKKSKASNSCATKFGEDLDSLNFSDIDIRLYRDGIEIRPLNSDCEKSPVKVQWTELSSVLKYNFI